MPNPPNPLNPLSHADLADRVIELTEFNAYTYNPAGVARAADIVRRELAALGAATEVVALPPAPEIMRDGSVMPRKVGPAVRGIINPSARKRILLNIHLDTVYPPEHPFQTVKRSADRLHGPGVADAKGGAVVLLEGLRRYLSLGPTPLGFEVLFNPDEEVGSPASIGLLREAAARCAVGLVFEPTFPDGAMVSSRKGSGTYTFVFRGREAHAGRDFAAGRNALLPAAELVTRLAALNDEIAGVTVNPGVLEAGSAANVVPGLAVLRVNVRAETAGSGLALDQAIHRLLLARRPQEGVAVELHGGLSSPPKAFTPAAEALLGLAMEEIKALGLPAWSRPSGGASDGNKLAAAGLPVLDSLGPTGGELHSDREYVDVQSLNDRAELLARLLVRLAD